MTVQIVGKEGEAKVAASRVRPAGPDWEVKEGSVVQIDLDRDSTLPLVALKGVVVRLDRFNGTCDVALYNGERKEKVALCDLERPDDYGLEARVQRLGQLIEIPHLQEALRNRSLARRTTTYKRTTTYDGRPSVEHQGTPGTESPGAAFTSSTWAIGQRVEARHENGERWYGGTVSCVHADGTVDVAFYGKGTGVKPDNVQPIAEDGAGLSGRVQAGALVEARFAGRSGWDPALIWARWDDGRVDLVGLEMRVRPNKVQALGTASARRRLEGVSKPPQGSSSRSRTLADWIDIYRTYTPKQKREFWYCGLKAVGGGYIFGQGLGAILLDVLNAMWGG
jgi:hypothetical protein